MLRFYAPSFASMMSELARIGISIELADTTGLAPDAEADREQVRKALKSAKPFIAAIPLSRVLRSKFARLESSVDSISGFEAAILLREFHNDLTVELTSCFFLMIRPEYRDFYENPQNSFSESTVAFSDAAKDMAAASRCYALDEWTACVFHLMRVLEHGLRSLAVAVGLPADAMAHENWHNIIERIEKQIEKLREEKKSPEKSAKLQVYSEAASQFMYFKDAWRNHVVHSRENYDPREADVVWIHVRQFMHHMSKVVEVTP